MESGVISELITYQQCEHFIKCNLSDILITYDEMIDERIVSEMSTNISILCWRVFEYVVNELYNSIDCEKMLYQTEDMTCYGEE